MKNYVQPGEVLKVVAPYAVASGAGMLVGALFLVATSAALIGAEVEGAVCGVYTLDKATGAGTGGAQGAKAYWDDTAKKITAVVATNVHVGYFTETCIDGDTTCKVKLLL
jgi:predicted RecA/RadA family phage recombinase